MYGKALSELGTNRHRSWPELRIVQGYFLASSEFPPLSVAEFADTIGLDNRSPTKV
jgi:hypothetical protein